MHESIVFCRTCTMSSYRKFTFAISSPDEFLVFWSNKHTIACNHLRRRRKPDRLALLESPTAAAVAWLLLTLSKISSLAQQLGRLCPVHDTIGLTQKRCEIGCHYSEFPLHFCIKIQGLFEDPEVAFSRTNSRWKFTAWTVLKQHVLSISVITGQF